MVVMNTSKSNIEATTCKRNLLPLLSLHLPQIEFQFSPFQDVSISPSTLTGATGNGGQQTTSQELFIQSRLELGEFLTSLVFLHAFRRPFLVQDGFFRFSLQTKDQSEIP